MNALVTTPLEGEILRPGDMMDIAVSLNPFHLGSETVKVPVGSTLAECVEIAKASHLGARPAYIVVSIGDQRVKPEWWPRIRVKRGAFVAIQGVPGKDSSSVFRSILGLVLAIAVSVAVPFLAAIPAIGSVGAALIGAGVAAGGRPSLGRWLPGRRM